MMSEKQLPKPRQKKSALWNHFLILDDTYVSCDVCNSKLSYKTTTNNLRKHLFRKHNINPAKCVYNSNARNNLIRPRSNKDDSVHLFNITNDSSISSARDEVQASVSTVLGNVRRSPTLNESTVCYNSIFREINAKDNQVRPLQRLKTSSSNLKLMSIFIKDYQPYSVVEEKGFRELVSFLNPVYQIPTKSFISNFVIPDLYKKCLASSKELIKGGDIFCVTLEMWTSVNADTHLSFTSHFLDDSYQLNTILLDCSTITFERNPENFAYHIKKIATEWGIEEKIQFVVSENDSNIQGAVLDILGYEQFNCFMETLNSVVREALQEANMLLLIEKVSSSISYIKDDTDLYNKLLTMQSVPPESTQGLTQISDTRCFRSLFIMLENFTKMEGVIKSVLEEVEDVITLKESEWVIVGQLCKVLKPFESVMNTLDIEKYCPASLVIPIVNGLLCVCNNLLKKAFLIPVKNMVNSLKDLIKSNLGNVESSATLSVCTFLDPRFKNLAFSSKALASQAKETIINALVNTSDDKNLTIDDNVEEELTVWHVIDQAVADTRDISANSQKQHDEELSVWDNFDSQVASTKPKVNANNQAIAEIQRYLDADMLPRQQNPLKWWLENKILFPHLSTLAKSQLGAASTSVPCDRTFSTSLMVAERRSKLSAKNTKMLVTLNANVQIY